MAYTFSFSGGRGQLVGSYVPIGYGSVIKYLDLEFSHISNTVGRYVTIAYWICDKYFDITNINMNTSSTNGPRYCYDISSSHHIVENNKIPYVNTDGISIDNLESIRFQFNTDDTGIKASKIFVAILSTTEQCLDFDYKDTTLAVSTTYGTTYIKDNLNSNDMRVDNNGGLLITNSLFINPDGSSSDSQESTNVKPSKIQCTDLRYRTWSDPDGSFSIDTKGFYDKYTDGFVDGGHDFDDVSESKFKTLSYTYNNKSNTLSTHIFNINNSFNSDFEIPEGRLKDVVFANPEKEAYDLESTTNRTSAVEARWVFKRSRIKFTIPPARKNGSIVNKGIILRYKIVTSIFNKNIYTTEYKIKEYSKAEAQKNIELVICPRDEGVLDNMEFTVVLSRKYKDAADNQYSTEANYKFHTYQKPTVNISSPKIIRNSATGSDFKYAKILTSNMYSNFNGEKAYVNKYVCDALNVMFATSQNDASDIPMFVRFYLAEYKYGRDGRVNGDSVDENFDTIQELYKSKNTNKYVTRDQILTGKTEKYQTAGLTGIYTNDGQPILLSGRFTNHTLERVGQEFKLWTYKDWDSVFIENDEPVGNAWEVTGPMRDSAGNIQYDKDNNPIMKTLTPKIVTDHIGAPKKEYDSSGNIKSAEQTVSKSILFRAGYVYLLRVRMFHGAAAGAIARNYSSTTKQRIIYGDRESGSYNYDGALYSDGKIYPSKDAITHGQLRPYDGWQGPNDGTPKEPLFNNSAGKATTYNTRLAQTYAGFSEVDYTLVEPVCPYTSKSNLITVHPTSPQISANQWITFNYRHLAKNVAGIDNTAANYNSSTKKYDFKSNVFGKTANNIQNTMSRIVSMYTSAVETILNKYLALDRTARGFDKRMGNNHTCKETNPELVYEKLSLWIKPITQRNMDNLGDNLQNFVGAYGKTNTNNLPLIYNYAANGRSSADIYNDTFYNPDSLCYLFNMYRKQLNTSNKNALTYDIPSNSTGFPENEIVYKQYNHSQTGNANRYLTLNEPLGNVYRWQPVINAVNAKSTVSEIQIEGKNNSLAKGYLIGDNTLRQSRTFSPNDIVLKYATSETDNDYDLQTNYFYKDEYSISPDNNYFTNTDQKRFCIKEFCGAVDGGIYDPGYPVMYTTASIPANSPYGSVLSVKYFCTALVVDEYPGHIYSRVPSTQDCECGIPTPNGLPNIGNISSKGAISINSNENNATPIVRTTHYLYFKTWINTTFVMKVDVNIKVRNKCVYEIIDGEETHVSHTEENAIQTFWFNGTELIVDVNALQNADNPKLLDTYPTSEIKFGNSNGLSEVYGEDNRGWGRCLSADDISNRKLNYDGTISDEKSKSGGLEVPVMVRYTPLLQPKLLAKVCTDINTKSEKYLSLASSNITLYKSKGKKEWTSGFVDGTLSDSGNYNQIETDQIDLKIAYPFIKEDNTYNTVSPNGGHSGNVYFDKYYIDVDSDASKSIDTYADSQTDVSTNMDFLGGNGICTAYTVILVPSDPVLPSTSSDEYKWYFNNTDEHWNFYKQPANYFKLGDIFNVRSKSIKDCGPVLVAYNLQPEYSNTCDYLSTKYMINNSIPNTFVNKSYVDKDFKGRNFRTIPLNFTNLRQGNFILFDDNSIMKYSDAKSKIGITLTKANILQPGVIYDLVIVPVYSNRTINILDYNRSGGHAPGKINDNDIPGGGQSEVFTSPSTGEVHLAGSNPLVLYNYLQIGLEKEKSNRDDGSDPKPNPDPPQPEPEEPDPKYVSDSDSAIVFPNVDNELFNVKKGQIKETPGFWLNNSFKLVLRMPSFREKDKTYNDSDLNTIDNASNGLLVSGTNTADDFEFSDIQIHIGKISELEEYGYPNQQHLILDKITDKDELAKAHIISYNDYGQMGTGVFSKKLSIYNLDKNGKDIDTRELLTAGSLDPTAKEYSHRFIEVNLSNCKIMDDDGKLVPVYTKYKEGYYIQFRWKSKYAESQPEEQRWSAWYGGTYDGGLKWWGANGLNYFVPIRNYSTIYTDFRNHIKSSYPGAYINMPKESITISEKGDRVIQAIVGKGSMMSHGRINESSLTKPKNASYGMFYNVGVGNHTQTPIVPTIESLNMGSDNETLNKTMYGNILLSVNNDDIYFDSIKNKQNVSKTSQIFYRHQQFWEMLYVDYIIRNMCKLYYKPKYNERNNSNRLNEYLYYHLSVPYQNNKPIILNYLTWGWDNTEYRMFNTCENIRDHKGPDKELEFTENKSSKLNSLYVYDSNNDSVDAASIRKQGPNNETITDKNIETIEDRQRWDPNKYYRRIITRQDFDELNNHLEELVEFMRHNLLSGLTNDNFDMIGDAVPVSKKELLATFPKARKGIIGHDTSRNSGLTAQTNNNNINHTMVDSNYIQKLWENIMSVCRPSIQQNMTIEINQNNQPLS